MPLYSEHIANMYYGGPPTYTSAPYGYSGSVSSLGTSYSAPYLNPGGSYSSHSSLGSYSRTPLTSRWITSSGRNYSPMLSTISERVSSSPVRLSSPRRIPIMKRTYGTSNYTPRPININTADIDVSKNKYQSKRKSPSPTSPKISPHKISSSIEKDSSPFMPRVDGKPETGIDSSPGTQRSTIKRGRTVVRLHTIKRKERDSPRKPTDSSDMNDIQNDNDSDITSTISDSSKDNSPEPTKWREKLSEDLIYKEKKEEKKSLGSKLVEKFILKDRNDDTMHKKSDEDKKNIITPAISDTNMVKCPDRRCSLELLAEQADLLDTLIRKENLSTATLDLSKIGVSDEPKTSLETYQSIKRRKSNESNPLKTTKSDNSLHDNLKSFKNQIDSKQFSKRRSLKKSSSGGSICRLDSITEFPKEPSCINLPAIEENRQSIKIETTKSKVKPKLKAKITSSVEVSAPTSPLKFRVENVTVEEKTRLPKKEIIYSSSVEDYHSPVETDSQNKNIYDTDIKKGVSNNVPPSPEPADGNFWDKIGKRETVYLLKRKQNIEECKEKDRRALFWFPEEEDGINDEITNNSNINISSDNNNAPLSINQCIANTIQCLKTDKEPEQPTENDLNMARLNNRTIETEMPQERNISPGKYAKSMEIKPLQTKIMTKNVSEASMEQENFQTDGDQHVASENKTNVLSSHLKMNEAEKGTLPENKDDGNNVSNINVSNSTNKDNITKRDSHGNKTRKTSDDIEKTLEENQSVLETASLTIQADIEEMKSHEKSVDNLNNPLDAMQKNISLKQNNETTKIIPTEEKTIMHNKLKTQHNSSLLNKENMDDIGLVKTTKVDDASAQENKIITTLESDLNKKPDSLVKKINVKQEESISMDNQEVLITSNLVKENSDNNKECTCGKLNTSVLNTEKLHSVKKQKEVETKTPKIVKAKSKSIEKNKCDESKSSKICKVTSDSMENRKQEESKSKQVIQVESGSSNKQKVDESNRSKSSSKDKPKQEEANISNFVNETDSAKKNKLDESKLLKPKKQENKMEKNMSEIKPKYDIKDKTNKIISEKNSGVIGCGKKASKLIENNDVQIYSDKQNEQQATNIDANNDGDPKNTSCLTMAASEVTIVNETPLPLDVKQSIEENTVEKSSPAVMNDDTSDKILSHQSEKSELPRGNNIPKRNMDSNETEQQTSGEVNKAEQNTNVDEQQKEDTDKKDIIKLPQITKRPVKEEAALRPLIATPRPLQKKLPQVIHSSSSSETSSDEDSSDDDDEDESDSSADSTEFFECENNADGRTSTGSNDSGFDSSAPTSPASFLHIKKGADVPGTSTGPVPTQSDSSELLEQELEQSTAYGLFRKTGRFTPPARSIPRFRKYVIDDFHFIKVLGKGSFGKVLLAELRDTEYYYAVKCLKKDVVLEDDDVECTLIERKVLALGTNHPYLCHLFATFQTDSHLFFVMEYLNGGDLMFHIQQSGRFPENRARFYAAEIVSGLKFLHKRGIVYRDLKLDNILLDFDGHVRIADFGMCKLQIYLEKTADTFCGTPDYMAPEIIKGLKYNQTVDWWSFGVLLYEMLIGQSPFSGCDEDELFWSICNEMPSYPRFLSQQALTILTRLLDKDAKTRLGGTECMHGDVRDQDFFHPIHWERLERRELESPFKPRVRHPLDTQYFDRAFTGERPRLTAVEPHVLRSMDQTPFRGFSYTNPNATDR